MNQKQAARALGTTDRTLREWAKEPWFPQDAVSGGVWDVEKIRAARDAEGRKGAPESNHSRMLDLALKAERLKQARDESRLSEIRVKQREGALIPRFAFEAFTTTLLASIGQLCDQLPDIVTGELPEEIREQARAAITRELDTWRHTTRHRLDEETRRLDEVAE